MADTLGSLCDKLTIVKLKQWHTDNEVRQSSLRSQELQLQNEINDFFRSAISGLTPLEKLTFAANKVYKVEGNEVAEVSGSIAEVFAQLAQVNCELWHEQEKVYDFESVPVIEKNAVVKALAHLNLRRNWCIDVIDRNLLAMVNASREQNA